MYYVLRASFFKVVDSLNTRCELYPELLLAALSAVIETVTNCVF